MRTGGYSTDACLGREGQLRHSNPDPVLKLEDFDFPTLFKTSIGAHGSQCQQKIKVIKILLFVTFS